MPEHALYYPEWHISDPVFLAESLLYWDRVACISPGGLHYPWHKDQEVQRVMAEAHEQFIVPVMPTEEQKHRAHERIEEFARLNAPEWCRPENLAPQKRGILAAQKVSPETLVLLQESGWAVPLQRSNGLELQMIYDAAADLVLGALAEACSSPAMPPVTDDPGSFTANCNLFLHELGAPTGITAKKAPSGPQPHIESDFAFLLAKVPHLSLKPEDVNADVLRRILQTRNDAGLDGQRKAFQRKFDEYLQKLRTSEEPERELVAIEFGNDLKTDQELLRRELHRAGLETIFTKEGFVAVVVGTVAGTMSVGAGLVIGLIGQAIGYRYKRQEAYNNHWSSWIFSATADKFSIW